MTHINPWKKYGSRVVYENPWIKVREDQVIGPSGHASIYGVVDTRIATGVVALTPDNQVYLVGQFRYPTDEYSWEIIEGGADEAENPLETAKRELREEAGLKAGYWIQLGGECHLSNCFSSEVGYLYLARDLKEVGSQPDETEILELKKVPFKECLRMVETGEIKDAITIIAIFRAERLLFKGG